MSLKCQSKANKALTLSIIGKLNDNPSNVWRIDMRKFPVYNFCVVCLSAGLVLIFIVNFYTGLSLYTEYHDCNPFSSGAIGAKDELLPFYIMDRFNNFPFVNGFFVAGIFAASLG